MCNFVGTDPARVLQGLSPPDLFESLTLVSESGEFGSTKGGNCKTSRTVGSRVPRDRGRAGARPSRVAAHSRVPPAWPPIPASLPGFAIASNGYNSLEMAGDGTVAIAFDGELMQ